jgi:GT2 family glycosyltransferase
MPIRNVSIIIPTYKDWVRLALCLESLAAQTYDTDLYQIIVVNNYTVDTLPAGYLVPENSRLITEQKAGPYAARNAGIKIAEGSILGFTDSDCIPDKNWIKNAVAAFERDPACDRIAGKIRLYYKSDKLTNAELYSRAYAFNQDLYIEQDGTGVTANMFSRRHVFDKVGLFREDLLSGGDHEWALRAGAANFNIKYSDRVIVNHPARHHLKELVKKGGRVGGGQAGINGQGSE